MQIDAFMRCSEYESAGLSLGAADSALLSLAMLRATWCARAWHYATSPMRK